MLKTTNRIDRPVNYSKVDKPRYDIYSEDSKVYQDSNMEFAGALSKFTSSIKSIAVGSTFPFTLSNFKIKKINYYFYEDPNLPSHDCVANIEISLNDVQIISGGGTSHSPAVIVKVPATSDILNDTIVDETITFEMTYADVPDSPGSGYMEIEGFQL
jgi:hypothetical protein